MTQLDLLATSPADRSEPSAHAPNAHAEFLNDSNVRPTVGQTTDQAPADQADQAVPAVGPGSRPWTRGPRDRARLGDPRNRPDRDGFHRYRGSGRRGPPGAAKAADEALAMALDELAGAREELRQAYATPPDERQARREALASALSKVALAGRFCDQLLIAHGRTPPDCEPGP